MPARFPSLSFGLPPWVGPFIDGYDFSRCATDEGRMRFVIGLARENIAQGGGPFGAAVFNRDTHELIAPGVNLVLPARCSVLHAEIVALMLAQKITGSYDLGRAPLPPAELVTSCAPCAMCLGAIPWSGVKRLVCGGRDEDARAIGFDEGAKVAGWIEALESRGIETVVEVCREEAQVAFREYLSSGGKIYNAAGEFPSY